MNYVIGLTGKNAAGKGEVAAYLQGLGYQYRSLSDILREEAKRRGNEPTREVLIALGREFREKGGPGVLAEETLSMLEAQKNYVIDSIRNPVEVEHLRKIKNFSLWVVSAPIEVRFNRAMKRGRGEDATDLDSFRRLEEKENSTSALAQQVNQTIEKADHELFNDGNLKLLHQRIEEMLKKTGFPAGK